MSPRKLLVSTLLLMSSSVSFANTITSDACAPGVRDFSVTATSVVGCVAVGAGNINGNNQADKFLIDAGWIFIDGSDGNEGSHNSWLGGPLTSGLSGTFTINASAYTSYDRIAIGFKSGGGQADPDWAIFELADNTLTGNWSISGQQALSHAMLYGYGTPSVQPPPGQVPEPASLSLLGIGLLGFATLRRRSTKRKNA